MNDGSVHDSDSLSPDLKVQSRISPEGVSTLAGLTSGRVETLCSDDADTCVHFLIGPDWSQPDHLTISRRKQVLQ